MRSRKYQRLERDTNNCKKESWYIMYYKNEIDALHLSFHILKQKIAIFLF